MDKDREAMHTPDPQDSFYATGQGWMTPCQLWTGSVRPDGYGQTYAKGKSRAAHRLAWIEANGREPTGPILHSCDTPLCVNPDHLREGSPKENMADAKARQRIRHGKWLTIAKQVLELRDAGLTINQIADKLSVSRMTVKRRLGHEKAANRMREVHQALDS